jgi:hypothetical protein
MEITSLKMFEPLNDRDLPIELSSDKFVSKYRSTIIVKIGGEECRAIEYTAPTLYQNVPRQQLEATVRRNLQSNIMNTIKAKIFKDWQPS